MEPVIINNTNSSEDEIRICNRPDVFRIRCKGGVMAAAYFAILIYGGRQLIIAPSVINTLLTILCTAMLAYYVYISLTAERRLLKLTVSRMIEQYNGFAKTHLMFCSDKITMERSDSGRVHIDYSRIRKITQADGLYLLWLEKTMILPVDKNGFEKGTAEEFEAFIRAAAPNAKFMLTEKSREVM